MAARFTRTIRSLDADLRRRPRGRLIAGLLLLGAWLAWFFGGELPLYETSLEARLEVESAAHQVVAPRAGTVLIVPHRAGQSVQAGDVIVELDAGDLRHQQATEQALGDGLAREIESLDLQRQREQQARRELAAEKELAVTEATARWESARVAAEVAQREAARLEALLEEGVAHALEVDRQSSRAQELARLAGAARIAIDGRQQEYRTRLAHQDSRDQELLRERQALQSRAETSAARCRQLQFQIERHRIRAPVAGRLDLGADLQAGAYLPAGHPVAAVIPAGGLQVVAQFPDRALGRLRAGQPARLRLHGFPWGQYGSLDAAVRRVAAETRDGQLRIELEVAGALPDSIPLQHGLPGVLEVEVEQVSPAALVLRLAGRKLTTS